MAATIHGAPTLLLVEDDAAVRDALTMLLSDRYVVESVANSAQALARVFARQTQRLAPHDVLLIDLLLGNGPDGIQCLRLLRSYSRHGGADAPAIAITGLFGAAVERRCAEAGFATLLPKPFAPEALEATIHALLAADGSEPSVRAA